MSEIVQDTDMFYNLCKGCCFRADGTAQFANYICQSSSYEVLPLERLLDAET